MKKTVAVPVMLFFLFVSTFSAVSCTPRYSKSAAICGTGGGVAGALIDKKNPWRGALIGGALGAITCMALTDLYEDALREAALTGRPVTRNDGEGRIVQAIPVAYNAQTRCRKVVSRAWDKGVLVGETEEEICEGEKVTGSY
jgi:hypothetical protein